MIRYIKSSLQWKLILMISSIVILIIATIGSFSYYKSSRAIQSDAQRFSNQILKQATLNLTRYINDNERFFQSLAVSDDFQVWTRLTPKDIYGNYLSLKNMENHYIDPYISYHPEALSIIMYNRNGNETIYRNSSTLDPVLDTQFTLPASGMIDQLLDHGKTQTIVKVREDYKSNYGRRIKLPVLTYFQKQFYNNQTAYLAVDISLEPTQQILNEIELGKNGQALIVNSAGLVISAPDLNLINTKLDQATLDQMGTIPSGYVYDGNKKQLIVYQSIQRTDWRVIVFVPYNELAKRIIEIRNWTIAMTLLSLCIAIILVYLVAHSVTKRLKLLRRTIKMGKLGHFDIRSDVKGTDEVAELSEAYNLLLDRIDSSIHLLAESKIVQQQAILSALQSQINSHFLYNALESINAMANLAGHQQIRKSTLALSNMLRYTSNYKESLVTLEDEVAHISDYIQIMDNLYRDEMEFHFDIDSEVAQAQCLKATIQPFVENCIKHGFEVTGNRMTIRISAYRWEKDYIRVEIEDNGSGINPEQLHEINDALNRESTEQEFLQLTRIGMLNVQYRLKTYYPHHQKSGISVERVSADGGTKVSVIFPYRVKERNTL
ncbi:sensor histidine kinase [Paenibacillus psychroresistens]|uniref:Sensor histidine kinase n=1 Tax=Paenibacillus psychroresistens TaxID=1778678 RepID=A0A6B8RSI3_9BACL|nr:sensor histidine kinase [Paenibacillus psychroresistens]QGQ98423.1 sensor histidine kinase [Paenibacillus psychroresistens]